MYNIWIFNQITTSPTALLYIIPMDSPFPKSTKMSTNPPGSLAHGPHDAWSCLPRSTNNTLANIPPNLNLSTFVDFFPKQNPVNTKYLNFIAYYNEPKIKYIEASNGI